MAVIVWRPGETIQARTAAEDNVAYVTLYQFRVRNYSLNILSGCKNGRPVEKVGLRGIYWEI